MVIILPSPCYLLVSGVARISFRNRKGHRSLMVMVAPGIIPEFPRPVPGINYNFRCEAISNCQVGTIDLKTLVDITLGISSENFKKMASGYLGRWDLVQLRGANFMSCTLEERIALILLELSDNFGVKDIGGTRLTISMRHQDLAELVCATRPRVTEFLMRFEEREFINRDKRHLIVCRERLEKFLGDSQVYLS